MDIRKGPIAPSPPRCHSTSPGATGYIDADLRDTDRIVRLAGDTLDFTQPVAIMLLGVLNFVLDTDEARAAVNRLLDAVPSGSYLAITHPTLELDGEANVEAMRFWNEHAKPPITARSGEEIAGFLDRVDLLEPGLVSCSLWRPDPTEAGGATKGLSTAPSAANPEIRTAYGRRGQRVNVEA
ncbi:SAM-dependent methyltransferase [Planotetraspora sp. GP83]|uniref:SAM-dependent methyltransferase n=1 Tax=Planotetraspora sp. GP83 TaxID=3156264 RepID=UPI003513A3E8